MTTKQQSAGSESIQVRDVSAQEISAFGRDGVAHLPAFVDFGTCARLLRAADARKAQPGPHSSEMAPGGTFWEERGSHLLNPDLHDFVFQSRLAEVAGKVLQTREVRFYFDHLFMLEADTAKDSYYWHQDQPYWSCDGAQLCSFWLALTDCRVDSGALEFVLGTDRGKQYLPTPFGDEKDVSISADYEPNPPYHDLRDQYRIVSWDIRAGDAILFNARIMHSSRGNHSKTQRRVAYSTRWIGDDMVFKSRPGYQDPVTIPDEHLADGEPLAHSKKFPLLWKRPA